MPVSKKIMQTQFSLDPANPPGLTDQQATRLDAAPIDYSDIPELPAEFWSIRSKAQITLRLDQDVLDFFRSQGQRYQTRINAVLRAFVDAHRGRHPQASPRGPDNERPST